MSIIKSAIRRIYNAFSLENPAFSLQDPRAWEYLEGACADADSGIVVTSKTTMGYPPFWRGVNLICNGVSKLPLQVYNEPSHKKYILAKDHPAYYLIHKKPNPAMNALTWKKTMQYHALICGNGFSAIMRRGNGDPAELLILDPKTTGIAQDGGRLWYIVEAGGMKRRLPAEDVFHLKGLSFDGLIGHDVIKVLSDSLGLGMAARKFQSKFFKNNATLGGIIMYPHGMPEAAKTQFAKDWKKRQEGADNAFKTAVLEDGIKWISTSVNPQQAEMIATRQFEVREVANILGLPPHKLGDASRLAYNSLEQENKAYLEDSLDPWLCSWEAECDDKLLTEAQQRSDEWFFSFDRSTLQQADSKTHSDTIVSQYESFLITKNEARAELNLPPTEDDSGDEYKTESKPAAGSPQTPQEDDPEPAGNNTNAAVKNALVEVLEDRIRRMVTIEADAVKTAAAKNVNAEEWAPGWIEKHARRVHDAITPAVKALCVFAGRGDHEAATNQIVSEYVTEIKSDIMSLSADNLACTNRACIQNFINSI